MVRKFHQDYLLNCEFETICLKKRRLPWREANSVQEFPNPPELLDYGKPFVRRVSVVSMDRTLGTVDKWNSFVEHVRKLDVLILVNDRPFPRNAIVLRYNDSTLKAYIHRLEAAGIKCLLTIPAA